MGLNFEFATATKIVFGNGSVKKVPDLLRGAGRRLLLVTGSDPGRAAPLTICLSPEEFDVHLFRVESEPDTETIEKGVELCVEKRCDAVVGIGGGSVLDSAKAIAALAPNKGALFDYLEVIGAGKGLEEKPLPFVAVPTTAGTGSEVSKNAVIHSPEHQVKVSLRSPFMFARAAVVDPELTLSVPPEITASTGMDALTHLLETYVSVQSNAFIDAFCREGLQRIGTSLTRAFRNGGDLDARENMAFASMLGGMALANIKLGAVHGFAGPMGGMFPVPHGSLCASLLPAVMEVNLNQLAARRSGEKLLKYDEVAKWLTGDQKAVAREGIRWVNARINEFKIPSLSGFGLNRDDFPALVKKAKKASSMKGNPVVLDDEQLTEILNKSL